MNHFFYQAGLRYLFVVQSLRRWEKNQIKLKIEVIVSTLLPIITEEMTSNVLSHYRLELVRIIVRIAGPEINDVVRFQLF